MISKISIIIIIIIIIILIIIIIIIIIIKAHYLTMLQSKSQITVYYHSYQYNLVK